MTTLTTILTSSGNKTIGNNGNNGDTTVAPTEQKGYVNEKVTSTLNVRKEATTQSVVLMSIPKNTEVSILGITGDWYKITVTYNKKTVTGFVAKQYITIKESTSTDSSTDSSNDNKGDSSTTVTDQSFEVLLANFPERVEKFCISGFIPSARIQPKNAANKDVAKYHNNTKIPILPNFLIGKLAEPLTREKKMIGITIIFNMEINTVPKGAMI